MYEYDPFEFDVITEDDGDVKSQLLTRVFENFESIKIIQQAIRNLPDGPITNRSWEMQDTPITKSYIEVPRGTLYHSYALEDGRVRNCVILSLIHKMCIRDRINSESGLKFNASVYLIFIIVAFIIAYLLGPFPVSYTHLDVYKRQIVGSAIIPVFFALAVYKTRRVEE